MGMIRNRFNRLMNFFFKFYIKRKYNKLSIGSNTRIDWNTFVSLNNNSCNIGSNVIIQSISRGYHAGMPFPSSLFIDVKGASIEIGDDTSIHGCYIHAQKEIKIGSKCAIAAGVNIIDSNGHRLDSTDRNKQRDNPESIIIGNNVWIGLNAIILKGTNIGDNSVVSAGSVVKGHFPENSLISGNPAKIIDTIKIKN
jgi:acetyltransferase-like isoleucine patch superfamily enzyme